MGDDVQQAAQLRAARPLTAEDQRPGRGRGSRQTCSSRAGRGRPCGVGCCRSATSTPCCACRPASSTPAGSRTPVLFFDGRAALRKAGGQRRSGSVTSNQPPLHTETETRCARSTWRSSDNCYHPYESAGQVRVPERFRPFQYDELMARDTACPLDITIPRDEWPPRTPRTTPTPPRDRRPERPPCRSSPRWRWESPFRRL